jgi:glycosyltransferase involved in cell wall biosynthesis
VSADLSSSDPDADASPDHEAADGTGGADARRRAAVLAAELEGLRAQAAGSEWLAGRIFELEAQLAATSDELQHLRANRTVRRALQVSGVLGRLRLRARRLAGRAPASEPAGPGEAWADPLQQFPEDRRYPTWVTAYDIVDDEARAAIRRRLDGLSSPPLVSVILPVYNTPEHYLREAIDSVRAQLYTNWELCIADDCSTSAWVPKVLEEYAALDPRIRFTRREQNGHISEASNTAVAMTTGAWISLFDHDDIMAEHALALAVLALVEVPDAGILYSDEDHIDDDGNRSAPYFKPEYDPILLLGQNYFSHLCMLRRDLVEAAGGYRKGYEGSQDWDLVLRVVEQLEPSQVVHVPHVLYHWRVHPGSTASSISAKPYAALAARQSVSDHLDRTGRRGKVLPLGRSGFNRVRWDLPEELPLTSVVVLPRAPGQMPRCVDSIVARPSFLETELVLIDDGEQRPPLRAFLRDRQDVRVVEDTRSVSDAALRNAGARASRGDVLCFVHDDVEVLNDTWLEEMIGLLFQPGIGAVGAKLLYPSGKVQHAGIVMGIGGAIGHVGRFTDRIEPGYFGRAMLSQTFSAVSWACMVVRREAFEAVGGFEEEHLSGAFADVDLCLRLGEAGWRVAWTPNAELIHHESPTDPPETDPQNAVRLAREIRYLHTRWPAVTANDPAYNPNLSLAHETWPLAWPPRVSYR